MTAFSELASVTALLFFSRHSCMQISSQNDLHKDAIQIFIALLYCSNWRLFFPVLVHNKWWNQWQLGSSYFFLKWL